PRGPLESVPVTAVNRGRYRARCAFTLLEAVVALGIAAMAATALSLGLASAIQGTESTVEYAIGQAMAEQIIDEALGLSYVIPGGDPYQAWLGPSAAETAAPGRSIYNDTDDFNGFVASPPEAPSGIPIGKDNGDGNLRHPNFYVEDGYLDRWKQQVEVYYVDEDDPSVRLASGATSSMRAIEVVILRVALDGTEREVARSRRVFTYIPEI
ncbi:MAG: type II secretion system protein, partial [Planctomycetales bacterium]|nr:type II secretion system protein [Planctomycetales bacterium]